MIESDDLVSRVLARASAECDDLRPASEDAVAEAETRLGFPLHPLLRALYERVGDGGFGPDYGVLGLRSAVEEYGSRRDADPSDPGWFWPEGVLPILTWGCAMYACVDCRSDDGAVLLFEPNPISDGNWADAWFVDAPGLAEWLERWLAGRGWYEEDNVDEEIVMSPWTEVAGRA
ncbi:MULTISPECIES: SMI1/KNR4 family protein [Nonomuraea]|uniref:SMI1/KNR4 family protein n=1 Tax=Nonomuraea mangrovi TaxID=2316207 RepID=A0ABW4STZ9_9ACTN